MYINPFLYDTLHLKLNILYMIMMIRKISDNEKVKKDGDSF